MPSLISGEATDVEEDLKNQIAQNVLSGSMLKIYFGKIGIKPVKDQRENMEKFIKWLEVEPRRRPFASMTRTN
jgi:hypothetical protein